MPPLSLTDKSPLANPLEPHLKPTRQPMLWAAFSYSWAFLPASTRGVRHLVARGRLLPFYSRAFTSCARAKEVARVKPWLLSAFFLAGALTSNCEAPPSPSIRSLRAVRRRPASETDGARNPRRQDAAKALPTNSDKASTSKPKKSSQKTIAGYSRAFRRAPRNLQRPRRGLLIQSGTRSHFPLWRTPPSSRQAEAAAQLPQSRSLRLSRLPRRERHRRLGSAKAEDVEVLPGFAGSRVELWRSRIHSSIIAKSPRSSGPRRRPH